jgi:hypothetical protein
MPTATDFGGFGAIGVPLFINPGSGNSQQFPGISWMNRGPYNKPIASSLLAAGSPTLTDKLDRLQMSIPSAASGQGMVGAVTPIPSTPYTLDVLSSVAGTPISADAIGSGLMLYDGTKYISLWSQLVGGVAAGSNVRNTKTNWTNRTTASGSTVNLAGWTGPLNWVRLTDDGTNRVFYWSLNGKDFTEIMTEATNTFLTPTNWGLMGYCVGNTAAGTGGGFPAKAAFYHMQATAGILGDAP